MDRQNAIISTDQTVLQAIDLLTALGFVEYQHDGESVPCDFEADFDGIVDNPDCIVMIERSLSRNMLTVVLSENDHDVYVLNDIGCGWVKLPCRRGDVQWDYIAPLQTAFS
jgi:hypothetical protein